MRQENRENYSKQHVLKMYEIMNINGSHELEVELIKLDIQRDIDQQNTKK